MEGAAIHSLARVAAIVAFLAGTQALHAQDDADGWRLDPYGRAEAGIVTANSVDDEDELIVNGDGLTVRGQAGVQIGDETTRIVLEADRIEVVRFGAGRRNTNRDRLTGSIEQELAEGWNLRLQARRYDDLVSAEFNDTDETQIAARATFEPERAHRFRLEASWRIREYDDGAGPGGVSSRGEGPRVDLDYRHRLGRYHYLNFDLRAERIDADNPERDYTRQSAKIAYTHPLTEDLRVRPAFEVRHTRFPGRLTPTGAVRDDTLYAPELELLYWPGDWRIEAEAKYIRTGSNEPVRDRRGYRLSLTVGRVF